METDLDRDVIKMFDKYDFEEGIKMHLRHRDMTFKKLCADIGMTENGLKASLQNRTIKLITLLKISTVFDVDLFDLSLEEQVRQADGIQKFLDNPTFDNKDSKVVGPLVSTFKYMNALEENYNLRKRLNSLQEFEQFTDFVNFIGNSKPDVDLQPLIGEYMEYLKKKKAEEKE